MLLGTNRQAHAIPGQRDCAATIIANDVTIEIVTHQMPFFWRWRW
jgi:hypothetical protein